LIGEQVLERQLHAIGHVGEVFVVADELLLDPCIDLLAPEPPLTLDLQGRDFPRRDELGNGLLVEMQIRRQLVHRQQRGVIALLFRHLNAVGHLRRPFARAP